MTNGIMRDPRVFHIDDEGFPKKYNMQSTHQLCKRRALSNQFA